MKHEELIMLNWVLERLREPSTYAGLAGLALAFGLTDAQWDAIATAVAGVAGLAAVFLAEKKA
jgi:hypothetical protein